MEEDKTTAQPAENEVIEPQGTTEAPATGSLDVDESESTVTPTVSTEELMAQLESERKERQKIEMERNQLKNKQEEDRKKQLEESNEFRTLYEESQAELEKIQTETEAQKNLEEANKLRDKIINEYPNETVRKAAKAAIEQNPFNFVWSDDVATEEEAKSQLFKQLDSMSSVFGETPTSDTTEEEPYVHPNNPSSQETGDPGLDKLKQMSAEEMKKFLPRADAR